MSTATKTAACRVGVAILALALAPRLASAAWPVLGRAVSTAAGDQDVPRIASDRAGGAIIVWQDLRGPTVNIFAQHVLASGELDGAWPADGRALLTDPAALATAVAGQRSPVIVSDGAGGAIVAWQDGRSGTSGTDIFAQHILASGAVDGTWPVNGAALCAASGEQDSPTIVADGAGGAIVAWMDRRDGDANADIFAQHVLSSGRVDPMWPVDGIPVCTATAPQGPPRIAGDGAGGAIVTWHDFRPAVGGIDIYAQHVSSFGAVDPSWPENGRALTLAAGNQLNPAIVSDGAHGAIVTWEDPRDGTSHIYAQRVTGSGTIAQGWPADGRAVCTAPVEQVGPVITPDGAGGAIVAWRDARNGANHNPFAQHILASGAIDVAWPVDGKALSLSQGEEASASIVGDGGGGAIVAWEEDSFVFAQHVEAAGSIDPTFSENGRFLRLVLTFQHAPDIVTAGPGSAIVTWSDDDSISDADIYAQQVLTEGTVIPCDGSPESLPAEVDDGVRLSRSGSNTVIRWNVALRATASSILRGHVGELPVGSSGAAEQCLIDDVETSFFADGDVPTPGDSFWYLVRGENACGSGTYGSEALDGLPATSRVSSACP